MALVDGGDLVVRAIKQEGVDTDLHPLRRPCAGDLRLLHRRGIAKLMVAGVLA